MIRELVPVQLLGQSFSQAAPGLAQQKGRRGPRRSTAPQRSGGEIASMKGAHKTSLQFSYSQLVVRVLWPMLHSGSNKSLDFAYTQRLMLSSTAECGELAIVILSSKRLCCLYQQGEARAKCARVQEM